MKRLLGRILNKLKPIRRDDPVFGSMRFMGEKVNYWEGEAVFSPSNSKVEVLVDGNKEATFDRQYEFFNRVCSEWPELSRVIGPKLAEAYWQLNQVPLSTPWEEFVVGSISIPCGSLDEAEWTISFNAKTDTGHTYFVEMKGRVLIGASYDS